MIIADVAESETSARPAEPRTAPSEVHVPALDGLRGIAISLVLILHFTMGGGIGISHPADVAFVQIALNGWIGVDLFLVLSGYLITGILYDARAEPRFFRNFYARRVLRIFPLYYVLLALLLYVLPRFTTLRSAEELAPWAWTYTSNVLLGWKGTGAAPTHFHPLWSLAVEEQFYLLWPPIVFLCSRKRLMQICWGCIAVAWLTRAGLDQAGLRFASYVFTPARMDTLAFGAFLAILARGPRGLAAISRWVVPIAAVSLAVLAGIVVARGNIVTPREPVMHAFGFPALVALFGMMVVAAVTAPARSWTARILGARPLRFLGKYSYAMYLFHSPVIAVLSKKGLAAWRLASPGESTIPAQLLVMAVAFAVTLALSLASWHLLEQPFLRLKRLFPYRAA